MNEAGETYDKYGVSILKKFGKTISHHCCGKYGDYQLTGDFKFAERNRAFFDGYSWGK